MIPVQESYKYKIAEILSRYPVKDSRKLRRQIREALGLSFVMFSRKLYSLKSEKTNDFSGTDLKVIAEVLGVTTDALYSHIELKEVV
jgi:hypothetical protein